MNTLPIKLNPLEIIYLADSMSLKDIAEGLPEKEVYIPLARQGLLLLGSAYVEVISPAGYDIQQEIVLQLSEDMTWLFWSKVKTGSVGLDGKTNIGIPLLLKLYAMLLEFNAGLLDVETCSMDTVIDKEGAEFLNLLKEQANARRESGQNANTD